MTEVLYEVADHVATITLNAPERMNTISGPMLARAVRAAARGRPRSATCAASCSPATAGRSAPGSTCRRRWRDPRAVSATSAARQSFTGEFELRDAPPIVLHNIDTPTVCALNGGAAGYGLDLALGCDIRVAADTAKLNPGFAKRGILPESGGTWLLPRMVGYAKAAEIAFTGRTLHRRRGARARPRQPRRRRPASWRSAPASWPARSPPTRRSPCGRSSG